MAVSLVNPFGRLLLHALLSFLLVPAAEVLGRIAVAEIVQGLSAVDVRLRDPLRAAADLAGLRPKVVQIHGAHGADEGISVGGTFRDSRHRARAFCTTSSLSSGSRRRLPSSPSSGTNRPLSFVNQPRPVRKKYPMLRLPLRRPRFFGTVDSPFGSRRISR